MTKRELKRVVALDACVLINFIHTGRLHLLGELPGCEMVMPDHVYEEITDPSQRHSLDRALEEGVLRSQAITELDAVEIYAGLRDVLGSGEAACLALAASSEWSIASDERGRFRREVLDRLGPKYLIGTKDLYLLLIQAGLLTVDEAELDRKVLEQHRFRMKFSSFRDLMRTSKSRLSKTKGRGQSRSHD